MIAIQQSHEIDTNMMDESFGGLNSHAANSDLLVSTYKTFSPLHGAILRGLDPSSTDKDIA